MTTATQRIPVLVTPDEKLQIAQMAKSAGMSMGEYLRRAAASFRPSEEDAAMEGMIVQILKTTTQATKAIDDALAYVEQSNRRIEQMETKARAN